MPRRKRKELPRVKRFVHEYVWGKSAGHVTDSAIAAGFGRGNREHAATYGCNLLRRKDIAEIVAAEQAEKAVMLKGRDVEIAEEMYQVAKARLSDILDNKGQLRPPREWPENVKAALTQFEIESLPGFEGRADDGEFSRPPSGVLVRVKLHDKKSAGELYLKWAGKLREKVELEGKNGGPIVVEVIRYADPGASDPAAE